LPPHKQRSSAFLFVLFFAQLNQELTAKGGTFSKQMFCPRFEDAPAPTAAGSTAAPAAPPATTAPETPTPGITADAATEETPPPAAHCYRQVKPRRNAARRSCVCVPLTVLPNTTVTMVLNALMKVSLVGQFRSGTNVMCKLVCHAC
jgi:hypothetical protein